MGLAHLVGRQVERVAVIEDRAPGQVDSDRLVEVLMPCLVSGQEEKRVAEEARRISPGLEDIFGRVQGRAVLHPAGVGCTDIQHDQPHLHVILHILSGFGEEVERV